MRVCIFRCPGEAAQIADDSYSYILIVLVGPQFVRDRPRITCHWYGLRILCGALINVFAKAKRSEAGVLLEGLGEMASAGKSNLGCDFVD